jgi:hypothetical protein
MFSFYLCWSPSLSVLLVRKAGRCSTSLIPRIMLYFLNLRDPVSLQTGLLRDLWEVIRLFFCLPKAGLLFEPPFLQVWWVGLPIGSQAFSGFLCATETYSPAPWERWVPPGLLVPVAILSQGARNGKSWQQEGKNTNSKSWLSPQKSCRIFKLGNRTPRLFRKQYLLAAQCVHIKRLSSENKRPLPYILFYVSYRSKKQRLIHIWLHTISLARFFSVLSDFPHVQIL